MIRKYIIGGLAAAALIAFGVVNLTKSVTPYVSFQDARTAKATVQIVGKLVKGTNVLRNDKLCFDMTDEKGDKMSVEYPKAPPANFDTAPGMACFGKYESGIFKANEISVKCPSKYEKKITEQK